VILTPVARNLDPLMYPFAKARERVRALNTARNVRETLLASLEGILMVSMG
jgi:DDB1- and CUL4-associated factor 13